MDGPDGTKGVRFQVEPIGMAKYRFEFPLNRLYYVDLKVDAADRIVTVESWRD
jgi:hypothetical protein